MTVAENTHACLLCGDTAPKHRHYTVLCYEDGRCLGRLGADGYTVNRKVFAVVFRKERAEQVATEINSEGTFTAKVKPF